MSNIILIMISDSSSSSSNSLLLLSRVEGMQFEVDVRTRRHPKVLAQIFKNVFFLTLP